MYENAQLHNEEQNKKTEDKLKDKPDIGRAIAARILREIEEKQKLEEQEKVSELNYFFDTDELYRAVERDHMDSWYEFNNLQINETYGEKEIEVNKYGILKEDIAKEIWLYQKNYTRFVKKVVFHRSNLPNS